MRVFGLFWTFIFTLNSCCSLKEIEKHYLGSKNEQEVFLEFLQYQISKEIESVKSYNGSIYLQKLVFFGDSIFDKFLPKYKIWKKDIKIEQGKMVILSEEFLEKTTSLELKYITLTFWIKDREYGAPYYFFTPFYSFDKSKQEFIIGWGKQSFDESIITVGKYQRVNKDDFKLIEEIDGYVSH